MADKTYTADEVTIHLDEPTRTFSVIADHILDNILPPHTEEDGGKALTIDPDDTTKYKWAESGKIDDVIFDSQTTVDPATKTATIPFKEVTTEQYEQEKKDNPDFEKTYYAINDDEQPVEFVKDIIFDNETVVDEETKTATIPFKEVTNEQWLQEKETNPDFAKTYYAINDDFTETAPIKTVTLAEYQKAKTTDPLYNQTYYAITDDNTTETLIDDGVTSDLKTWSSQGITNKMGGWVEVDMMQYCSNPTQSACTLGYCYFYYNELLKLCYVKCSVATTAAAFTRHIFNFSGYPEVLNSNVSAFIGNTDGSKFWIGDWNNSQLRIQHGVATSNSNGVLCGSYLLI